MLHFYGFSLLDQTLGSCYSNAGGGKKSEDEGERSLASRETSSAESFWSVFTGTAGVSF